MLYAVCGGGTMPRTEARQILTDLLDKAKADAQGGEVTFAVLIEHRPDYSETHAVVVEWCREQGVPCDVWAEPGTVGTNPVYNSAEGVYDDRSWVELVQAFSAVDTVEVLALFVDPYEPSPADDVVNQWVTDILNAGIVCRAFNAQMYELENDEEDIEAPVAPEVADLAAAQEQVDAVINGPVFGADPEISDLAQRLADIPEAPAPSYIEKFSAGQLTEDDLRQLGAQDLRELCKAVGAEPENWRAKDAMVAALVALWDEPSAVEEEDLAVSTPSPESSLSPLLEASRDVSEMQQLVEDNEQLRDQYQDLHNIVLPRLLQVEAKLAQIAQILTN